MNASAKNYFESFSKSFDASSVTEAQRKGLSTLTKANQAWLEGVQSVAQRQVEITQSAVEQALEASRSALSSPTPEVNTDKQVALAKQLFEEYSDYGREAAETLTKSGYEAFDLLSDYFGEQAQSVKANSKKK